MITSKTHRTAWAWAKMKLFGDRNAGGRKVERIRRKRRARKKLLKRQGRR